MKFKLVFVALLLLALVGSFFAGAYRERIAYDHLFMRRAYRHAALDTDQRIRVLTYLREGRTPDALSTLETLLDSSLTTFAGYERAPASERDDSVLRAIRDARTYRDRHPWAADADVEEVLAHGK
jgi:hypothetical protein